MILALALSLCGCAMRHVQMRGEVVIPNDCIEKLEVTEKTYCHGPDGKHIKCDDVTITRQAGCEQFSVAGKNGGKK
jgi:hypothetical protein